MTVPQELAAEFEQAWKTDDTLKGVRIVATEKVIDPPRVPTLILRQTRIGKCPELPLSHRNVGILATIVSPSEDMDNAGPQLSNLVGAILDYLDPRYAHDDAEQVGYRDRLAYDIPITARAKKD